MTRYTARVALAACMTIAMAALAGAASLSRPRAWPRASADDESVVRPPCGPIQGKVTPYAREFRGIPYATPPVGEKRWTEPTDAAPWTSTRQATMDGPGCPQSCDLPPHGCPPVTNEDCLLLNVFTPRAAPMRARDPAGAPVMLFLHGGNMRQGYAGGPAYDGTHIANTTGTITVVVQYRLGPLGWLTSNGTIPSNLGLMDMLQALRWVQANIAAFGGSADDVTVFGQSAGAVAIAALLTTPKARGLFKGAIMESEPFGIPFRSAEQQRTWTDAFGRKYANCSLAAHGGSVAARDACLRGLSADQIVAAQVEAEKDVGDNLQDLFELFWPWGLTIGDGTLDLQPFYGWQRAAAAASGPASAVAGGLAVDVPLMIGTNHDEGTPFIYKALGKPASRLEYDIVLGVLFGVGDAIRIGEAYPVPKDTKDARATMATAATDGLFRCVTRNASLSVAAGRMAQSSSSGTNGNSGNSGNSSGGGSGVWLYQFNKLLSYNRVLWGANYTECWTKVCHAGELAEVWHPNATVANTTYAPDEQVLSTAMEAYWTQFARHGDPGSAVPGAGLPPLAWPSFDGAAKHTMWFDTPNVVVSDPHATTCALWDHMGYAWLNK